MLSEKMIEKINEQINKEFFSAYLYQTFANYYGVEGLEGFKNWYNVQAKEEMAHAMIFVEYLIENDAKVRFSAIDDPTVEIEGFADPLKKALEHEKLITASINDLYDLAVSDRDYRTQQVLNWFIKEQHEEEVTAADLITRYNLFGEDRRSLWEMNASLASRTFTPPTLEG